MSERIERNLTQPSRRGVAETIGDHGVRELMHVDGDDENDEKLERGLYIGSEHANSQHKKWAGCPARRRSIIARLDALDTFRYNSDRRPSVGLKLYSLRSRICPFTSTNA